MSRITRPEFDKMFNQLLDEWHNLPWKEWTGKTEHTEEDLIYYFSACKERFYVTLTKLPEEILALKNCLEIGNGFFSAYMKSRGAKVTSVSRNLGMHAVWAASKGIETRSVDITQGLPFPDNTFDVIFFCEVMEHVLGYPEDYLKDFCRTLKPGGYLVLTTPNLHRTVNKIRFLFGKNFLGPLRNTSDGLYHIREYGVKEIAEYLTHSGFTDCNVGTFNFCDSFMDRIIFQLGGSMPNLRRKILAICKK